jgi:hypothetical protein
VSHVTERPGPKRIRIVVGDGPYRGRLVYPVAELAGVVGPRKAVAEPAALHTIGEVEAVLAHPPRYLPNTEPLKIVRILQGARNASATLSVPKPLPLN